jgi:hypothetical protein
MRRVLNGQSLHIGMGHVGTRINAGTASIMGWHGAVSDFATAIYDFVINWLNNARRIGVDRDMAVGWQCVYRSHNDGAVLYARRTPTVLALGWGGLSPSERQSNDNDACQRTNN